MMLSDLLKDEVLDELIVAELKNTLEMVQNTKPIDQALVQSLNVVIAYYSVPGTHMEGSYDG